MMSFTDLILLALLPLAQDPAPADTPAPQPVPEPRESDPAAENGQEPEAPEERGLQDMMQIKQEVEELIHTVREDFARVDQRVSEARQAADAQSGETQVQDALQGAVEEADVLIENMETLLEKLWQTENQDPSGAGGQQNRRRQPQDGQQQQQEQPGDVQREQNQSSPDEPLDGSQGGDDEQRLGNRPPDSLRRILLFDQRRGKWGKLPPRLQGALENSNAEDLPLRYRRWLEEYHRRSHGN